MKQSKYNFFYELDNGQFLIYNALKNGLAVVDKEMVNKIKSVNSETDVNNLFGRELLDDLQKGGFIIDDDFDEYGLLKIRRHMQQYFSQTLAFTIAPTINCNLACKYCFENPDKAIMDESVEDAIIKFAEGEIKAGKKAISVTWYGGEPLLCMKVIERLSGKFIKLCKENNVLYNASVITNGTLYKKDVAEKLKELQVQHVQITLDGHKEMHDNRRPYRGVKKSSFEVIIKNLEDTVGILPVALRINVDRENAERVVEFVKELRSNDWFDDKFIKPYFGYVRKYTSSCRCHEDECLLPGEFWQRSFELQQFLVKEGMTEPEYPNISSGCGATSIHSYVVGPKGELYKCWNHVGEKEQIVGYIDKPIELNSLYVKYLNESFEQDEECKECKYLPICMGGCVDVLIKTKNGEMAYKDCTKWKEYLAKQLKFYYQYRLNKQNQVSCTV